MGNNKKYDWQAMQVFIQLPNYRISYSLKTYLSPWPKIKILKVIKMNFQQYDLGNLDKGRVVEITLSGSAANVQLLDSSNFSKYKNGRKYRYVGGLVTRSPIRLQTTHSGGMATLPEHRR